MMKSRDTYEDAVQKVRSRKSYGIREEVAKYPGIRIIWSNSAAEWYPAYYMTKRGENIRLDANELLIYTDKKTATEWCKTLPPLPLYGSSFEAAWLGKKLGEKKGETFCDCSAVVDQVKRLEKQLEEEKKKNRKRTDYDRVLR